MQLGMIGLGRMGGNIVRRLMKHGHSAVVYDKDPKAVAGLAAEGATGGSSLQDFVSKLERPRTAWVMLPAGKITEATIDELTKWMEPGDVIIDGGNSFWQDDVRRGKALKERGIHYVDVGTSGGVWGIEPWSIASTRFLRAWRRALATSRAPRDARDAMPESSKAIFTQAPSGQVISSR